MAYDSTPDIYLMKRQKTRAGCLTALIVTAVAAAIVGIGFAIHAGCSREAGDDAEPVVLPEGAVEAPLAPVELPAATGEAAEGAEAGEEAAVAPAAGAPGTPATPGTPEGEVSPASGTTVAGETGSQGGVQVPVAAPPATPTVQPEPLPATPEAAAEALATAKRLRDEGDLAAARTSALAALAAAPGDPATEQLLNEIDIPLLASRRPMPEKVEYAIRNGDYLGKIAAKFNTPVALISIANDISDPTRIRVGQELLLFDGNAHRFAVAVSKSRNDLLLTLDGAFFKRYRVATGRGGKTPVGTFKIIDKIEHPAWHVAGRTPIPYGDPDNLLGTHWLALDIPGYGLHGTWDPASIGAQASDGCVRLLNDDIQELYTILPKGTVVTITD